jgi:hypothetical protein
MKNFAIPLTLVLAACSSSDKKTSSFEGTVPAGYTGAPSAIRATDEAGTLTRAKLASNGSFQLTLNKGHSYRFDLLGAGAEPLVFPRASGRLDTVIRVSGGGARVSLGQLHHFDAMPTGGFTVVAQVTQALMSTTPQAEQCVNGTIPSTGAACANDNAGGMVCEGGEGDDGEAEDGEAADGECVNGKDSTTGLACTDVPDATDGGGECVNGKDSVTGAACVDDEAADPAQPMGVPDHNVPDDVGGCDGEEEDD